MKSSLNICFLELLEEIEQGLKNKLELAMVKEPSVFEPLRFHCVRIRSYKVYSLLVNSTSQPLYNTVVGVHSINGVS